YQDLARINENNAHPATTLWSDPDISALSLRIIDEFFDRAPQYGTKPVLIFLPNPADVTNYVASGIEPLGMTRIAGECRRLQQDCLFPLYDSVSIFGAEPLKEFSPGGHYNPTGNRAMARWIAERVSRFIN